MNSCPEADLLMRSYFGAAEAMRTSCACLFVDAVNAFATCWARSAVDLPESDEHCIRALTDIGLEEPAI